MLDVVIELRKYAGARGGRAVLITIAALTVLLAVTGALVTHRDSLAVSQVLAYPMALLEIALPIVVVLMFAGEWSSRDAVQTFLLRPRRGAVLRAKGLAAVVVVAGGLVLCLVATVLAVAVRAVATSTPVSWAGLGGRQGSLTGAVLTTALHAVFATGIGLLVARTALALVVYLGAITVVEAILALSLGERSVWLSLGAAIGRISGADVHRADLPSLATSLGLWIVLPLALGGRAFLRREAK